MTAAYRRTYSPSQVAWSEGRQPLGAVLHSSNEPSELSQWPCGHDDRTINIVVVIIIIIIFMMSSVEFLCMYVCACMHACMCVCLLVSVCVHSFLWTWALRSTHLRSSSLAIVVPPSLFQHLIRFAVSSDLHQFVDACEKQHAFCNVGLSV